MRSRTGRFEAGVGTFWHEAQVGISSPAGSCVWHVVGLQQSVREWAIRQGWGGRSGRSRRRVSWWRRSGCCRRTSGMARTGGLPERCSCDLDGRFRIEEQKSAATTVTATRDPTRTLRTACEPKAPETDLHTR
jgi:hypothetical protein